MKRSYVSQEGARSTPIFLILQYKFVLLSKNTSQNFVLSKLAKVAKQPDTRCGHLPAPLAASLPAQATPPLRERRPSPSAKQTDKF